MEQTTRPRALQRTHAGMVAVGVFLVVYLVFLAGVFYFTLARGILSPSTLLTVVTAGFVVSISVALYALRQHYSTLEQASAQRSRLLHMAFHALGGPITILSGSLELLTSRGPNEPVEKLVAEHAVNLRECIQRLSRILDSFRVADEVDQGRLEYQQETVSVNQLIRAVVLAHQEQLGRRHQSVNLSLASDARVEIDKKLFERVIAELLTNAMLYSPYGSTMVIRTVREPKHVLLSVQDSGCGIPARDLSHLFQAFVRGSNARTYNADGSGLSLFSARGIVTRAGGTIGITSMEGKGTTVHIDLPSV